MTKFGDDGHERRRLTLTQGGGAITDKGPTPFLGKLLKAQETCACRCKSYPTPLSISWEASENYPISRRLVYNTPPFQFFFSEKSSWDKRLKIPAFPKKIWTHMQTRWYNLVQGGGGGGWWTAFFITPLPYAPPPPTDIHWNQHNVATLLWHLVQ